jgi:hypothetical protein
MAGRTQEFWGRGRRPFIGNAISLVFDILDYIVMGNEGLMGEQKVRDSDTWKFRVTQTPLTTSI